MTSKIEKSRTPFDAIRREDGDGEYWMARELMPLLGYEQWRRFNDTINRAMTSMANEGKDPRHHFSQVIQVVTTGNLGPQRKLDFRMTRYACYLTAMNGDTSKREIAAAQAYFVTRAREAELAEQTPKQFQVPRTFQEALRAYADEIDARERAELREAEARAEAEMLRPPAEAWENLVEGADGDYSMAEAAAILNRDPVIETGQNRLRDWMLGHRMMYRRANGQLVPYSEHLEHIRLKPQTRPDYRSEEPGGRKEAHSQVRVTARGLRFIQSRMREERRPELVPAQSQEPRVVRTPGGIVDMNRYREIALRRG